MKMEKKCKECQRAMESEEWPGTEALAQLFAWDIMRHCYAEHLPVADKAERGA